MEKPQNNNLTQIDNSLPVVASESEEYDVDIWWVKNVRSGDAKQAEITMKALIAAGLKPRLVAHALEKGHGYEIENFATCQRFTNLTEKLGGVAVSERAVGVYEVIGRTDLAAGEQTLEQIVSEEGLIRPEVISNLEAISKKKEQRVLPKIEMTVVIKQEPPKQITDNFVHIDSLRSVEDKKVA